MSPAPRAAWRSIVEASEEATPYHTPEWVDAACDTGRFKDVSRLYEHPDGGRLVLPLLQPVRGGFGIGSEWSMPPGWGFGGLVAPHRVRSTDVAVALHDISSRRGQTVIKPGPLTGVAWERARARRSVGHVVHVVDLAGGFGQLWDNRFRSGTRNKVRKAEKRGVEVEWDTSGRLLTTHYEVYLDWARRRARDRGTPLALALRMARRREPFAVEHAVARRFGRRCRVGIAWVRGEVAASLIVLRHGRHAVYWHAASDKDLVRTTYATYLLVARALEDAAADGCDRFHMGESGGVESLMAFKERFGAERCEYLEHRFEPAIAARAGQLSEFVAEHLATFGNRVVSAAARR